MSASRSAPRAARICTWRPARRSGDWVRSATFLQAKRRCTRQIGLPAGRRATLSRPGFALPAAERARVGRSLERPLALPRLRHSAARPEPWLPRSSVYRLPGLAVSSAPGMLPRCRAAAPPHAGTSPVASALAPLRSAFRPQADSRGASAGAPSDPLRQRRGAGRPPPPGAAPQGAAARCRSALSIPSRKHRLDREQLAAFSRTLVSSREGTRGPEALRMRTNILVVVA